MDLTVLKKAIKKTQTEHQKAGKIIQIQKYLNKGKRFSANNKARAWPSPTGQRAAGGKSKKNISSQILRSTGPGFCCSRRLLISEQGF